jgi:pyruvate dehydrogenase E2 component (dihydrolipoamide acetyltransferase)
MAQILGLPKLSPTMEEGVLVRWTKKEGDKVSPGDLIAEVETDKANMDFNVEDEGVLLKLLAKEGETVKLGAPVAIIGKAGEDVSALLAQAQGAAAPAKKADPAPAKKAEPAKQADAAPEAEPETEAEPEAEAAPGPAKKAAPAKQAAPAKPAPAPAQAPGGRLLASPLAKSLAIELGIDLRHIQGTGPGGRIVERDVRAVSDAKAPEASPSDPDVEADAEAKGADAAAPASPTSEDETVYERPPGTQALAVRQTREPAPEAAGDFEDHPASSMRKRIAARLTEAKRDVPHFYLMRQLDAAPLLGYRQRLNDLLGDRGKISVNDLVVKAVALALRRMPECNASWTGDAIRRYRHVHVGIAVAIEDGLVTPVVRDADLKGIGAIAAEIRDLAERAKSRRLKAHEISGSTFTVSNLGMFGVERFTAILNPPEAGILAIGAVADVPVVEKGALAVGKRMAVTMSCDHRVIDGALGARWLQVLAELVEKPESLAL